jgi:hypothetical protein
MYNGSIVSLNDGMNSISQPFYEYASDKTQNKEENW